MAATDPGDAAPPDARSLASRMVTAALAGSLVVALVAVLLGVPLVRGVAQSQSRDELVRAVDTLARTPRLSVQLLSKERTTVGPDDRRYGLLTAEGGGAGSALDYLTPADTAEVRRTGTLSTRHRVGGREYLVEARAVERGTLAGRGTVVVGVQPTSGVGAATGALLRRLGLALLLGLLAAGVVTLLSARRTTARVRDAADRAHRLAAGERGLPEPPPAAVREVDEMSRALTALDRALATSEARQREFLLSISHELRTPLTALRGYAEALRDGAVAPDQTTTVGETLTAETRRLDQFIADLLALARLEADDFRLQTVTVDPAELLTSTAAAWQATAASAGVVLRVELPDRPAPFPGDPVRVRQLLDGLVENAMRATPSGGEVQLRAVQDAAGTALSVVDSGPGLEPGDHERAFERGYLRDRYAAQRAVGTGLGLSIAQRLCERMGGSLTASAGDPTGTVMTVRFDAVRGPGTLGA
ncbi:sensor histidine kinase [Nocardioides pocheonensis]|uniref:sensor histidine kinase n=1 Tax=Nocardioides pocheonensis TaxID=661485 RepID=UPI001622835B|nr:HAMP domain-containing sensor histidine kinase [Nocardioides pocheonensis]